ncbi:Hypothetical protein PHPALM_15675 [Phytophthora palmivora]|uniref:Uncharacterized protein n=1 Tax=Phytophthora palmivora TaxID=4796 RepID=A0A2P4XRJ4_9STRA|nr:Hypothetical protein PHPALM_15675 [Phytophthora palmivora]
MAPRRVSANALAFVGPPHVPDLTEFSYVRLVSADDDTATVVVVGPDVDGNGQEVQLPLSTFELRKVDAEEATLWPGSYLVHPVAFVLLHGPCVGQWAYGVVVRYEVNTDGTWLSDLSDERAISIGATVSYMVLNPKELLQQQDTTIQACQKRKGDVLTSVRPTLTVPFVPDDLVTLMRPHDLNPQATTLHDGGPTVAPAPSGTGHLDELLSIASPSDAEDDIQDVRNLGRTLGKRSRSVLHDSVGRQLSIHDDIEADSDDDEGRGAFRPSRTQRRSEHPSFLRLPPVCRGLWEFGFLSWGLTLMHCRPADLWEQVHAQAANVSFTDFGTKHTPSSTSRYL